MDLEPGRGPLQTVGTWIIPLKFLSELGSRTGHLAPRTFCQASVSIDGDMRISFFMVPYFDEQCYSLFFFSKSRLDQDRPSKSICYPNLGEG